MTQITNTPCTMTVNGQLITGREWLVDAPMPHAGEVAATYRTRNTGKTRVCYTFLGVPCAVTPRFLPSVKAAPTGPIDASKFGLVAPQGYSQEGFDTGRGRSDLGLSRGLSAWAALGTREGEGPARLNFYSPTLNPAAGLPVVLHLHGGGSNYLSACDDRMSPHRGVLYGYIVARLKYRLGNLGHYFLPGMAGEGTYVGVNFSISDVFAAFIFLQDHVADMGGDPDNITIMGGSAGGNMCHVLLADPAARPYFHKVWSSSASAGVNTRWQMEPKENTWDYEELFGKRRQLADVCGKYQRSTQNNLKTLANIKADLVAGGATQDEAYRTVMREHISLSNFMSFDEGATGRQLYYEGYQATRSLTIMRDGETCFHDSNLDFALSGDVPWTHNCVFVVCENEGSIVSNGQIDFIDYGQEMQDLANATLKQWADSPVFNTEWNGATASPLWGTVSAAFPIYPWSTATEPNRMLFNHGYQYPAYCMARAVEAAGAQADLVWCNVKALSGGRVDHTADEPIWFGNTHWLYPEGGDEQITEAMIQYVDGCARAFANFVKHGNTATPYVSAWDFDLFAAPTVFSFTAFDPASKNWNVMGNGNRSGSTSLTITNTPEFWGHAWDWYDQRRGL